MPVAPQAGAGEPFGAGAASQSVHAPITLPMQCIGALLEMCLAGLPPL